MRASVQASKLGCSSVPSTPIAEVKDFSALGFTSEVTVGDETKMPLIQRLLQHKMVMGWMMQFILRISRDGSLVQE